MPRHAETSPIAALVATLILAAPAAAASPDVVISQLYGAGGNSGAPVTNDFVELFNRGAAPANVDRWSVQYAAAAGTSWTSKVDLAGTLPPGGRYLIQLAGGTGPMSPAPDLIGAISMSATNGKVALVTSTTPLSACGTDCSALPQVRDFAGYGTADDFEGTGPIPALDALNAGFRAEGGCQDTDDNVADFSRAAPAPRNSAGPAAPCTGPQPPVAACGGPLRVIAGDTATRAVSATDPNGRVTGLALTGTVPGIELIDIVPSAADGAPATGTVTVGADVAPGTYATTLTATGADGETGTCALAITVAAFDATPVGAVQGSGYLSPLTGQTRSIEGVVTGHDDEIGQSTSGVFPEDRGLFVQDAGDGDDATSDGIFVAEILDPEMLEHFPIGTRVRVTGVVREKFDQTILDTNGSAAAVVARGTDAVPAPVTLDPVQAKAQAGTEDGRAYYERFEGMRVRIAEGTANSGGTNKFGELFLTLGPEQDRVFRTDTAQDLIAADSDAGAGNPAIPYRDEDGSSTTVHADLFDRVSEVVGPMSYDFSNYRVVVQPDVVPIVDRTPGPAYPYDALSPSAPDELRVASFNVENFFGAGAELDGGDVSEDEFLEKRDRIADAIDRLLERPDVVAVQEVDELAILQDVATELGGYTAYLREGNDERGIDVGFLVKNTVDASNPRQWGKAQAQPDEVTSTCSDIPGRLFDRPPLSIDVERGGVELTVFSNHFASKSTPSNQDCRVAQAAFVAGAAADVEDEGREVLVAGDLNDFEDEGAPTKLGETLNPLWGLAPAEQRYSFQFSGRLQTLDHMFVSDGLLDRVRDFTYAHFDNDYFERPGRADGHHVSDHDPPVVTLRVGAPAPPPPDNLAAPTIAGRHGWLVGLPGEWRDADEFAYRWLRCPTTALSSCAMIRGATAPVYRVQHADRRRYLRFQVTATGDGGTTVASSAPVWVSGW